jgi:hypothetical protein
MKLEVTLDTERIHADMIKDGWCLVAEDISYRYYANQKKKRADSAAPNEFAAHCKEADPNLKNSCVEHSVQDDTSPSVEKLPAVENDNSSEAMESVAESVRRRLTEWMIRNGSTEAMAKMLKVSPEESAIVDNPRVLASRLAYSVFPPTSDVRSADLLASGERQCMQPVEAVQSDEASSRQ